MLVPFSTKWTDPHGRAELKDERMLNERDLAHLLEEADGRASTSTISETELTKLRPNLMPSQPLPRAHAAARVLYVDLGGASSLAALVGDGWATGTGRQAQQLAAACGQRDVRYCRQLVRHLVKLSDTFAAT